jgi:hypothetical protein
MHAPVPRTWFQTIRRHLSGFNVNMPPSQFNRRDRFVQHLLLRIFQLVLQMDFACRDNEVNPRLVGPRKRRRRSGSETRVVPAGRTMG